MNILITGCAGFIGSHWLDALLAQGHRVVGIDNLSSGFSQHLSLANENTDFRFINQDLLILDAITPYFKGIDLVCHLAANADVRHGPEHPLKDHQQNTLVTLNVLEAMRRQGVKRLVFTSTAAVYGEPEVYPTPEAPPLPKQTSLYGASKFAAEAFIQAYAHSFAIKAVILRLVSLVGPRYSHGHIFDFVKQLKAHPDHLAILGDGQQCKSYLHINDCVQALLLLLAEPWQQEVSIYNLGHQQTCTVLASASWIAAAMSLSPSFHRQNQTRGWIGDNPRVDVDSQRIRSLGFSPHFNIEQGIYDTVTYLLDNPWLLDARH